MITDRTRITIMEVNTDRILTRDLVCKEIQMIRNLSAPCQITFKVPQGEQTASAAGITWKNWGQWIIAEIEVDHVRKVFCCALVTDNKVDPATGDMQITGGGFLGYPKGIPWLENYNPIAVDPAEIIQRVWSHLESFSNANLNVEILPSSTGTQMLPGYGFDGNILNFDFFAIFQRAVDFNDCGDQITSLARDLPLDLFENAYWNSDRTFLHRECFIAYPLGGVQQNFLSFRLGDNVISADKAEELDIEPVSDVIIRGWLPGKVYSSRLSNADPTRARRVIMEEDAHIDSTERAAAWAKRKLTRRNIPKSFSKITIDHSHPDAPFGSFDVGDSINIEGYNFPWYGTISGFHRITSISWKDGDPTMDLSVKVDGAFNYDPIEYDPDYQNEPVVDTNRLQNGYFRSNLSGWTSLQGQWFRVTDIGYDIANLGYADIGSVRVDCDDSGERFLSGKAHVDPGERINIEGAVSWADVVSGTTDQFKLVGFMSLNGVPVGTVDFDDYTHPNGTHGFEVLRTTNWLVPDGINELAIQLTVTSGVTAGKTWWSGIRVYPTI